MVELNRFHPNGLRAIEVVARRGTLARAAMEVGAVSQLVIKTEKQLGRPVFKRTASGLTFTPFGHELFKHLGSGFNSIAKGVASASKSETHSLRVSTTLSFAEKWLLRRLPDFQASNPKLRVQIDSGLDLKDLNRSEAGVALRFGQGQWPGTKAKLLTEYFVLPECSPADRCQFETKQDLYDATIIWSENAREPWENWARIAGMREPLPQGLAFSEAALCVDAAIVGRGVALGSSRRRRATRRPTRSPVRGATHGGPQYLVRHG